MNSSYWKRMSSGKYIDLGNFKESDVNLVDVTVALNHTLRFNGHFKDRQPLTVAEHSVLCLKLAQICEPDDYELHRAVIAHDFAEAYIGDVSSPVKKAMGDRWKSFAEPIERTVEISLFGSLLDFEMHDRVKIYDLASLDIERRVMWESQLGKDKWPMSPLNFGTIEEKKNIFDECAETLWDLEAIWQDLCEECDKTETKSVVI